VLISGIFISKILQIFIKINVGETTADGKTFMRLFVSKQVKTIVVLIAMVIYR